MKKIFKEGNKIEQKLKQKGIVYIVKFGEIYKIGKTTDMAKRMTQLLVSNPFVKTFFFYEVMGYDLAEKALQISVKSKKVFGEWYRLGNEDFVNFDNLLRDRGFIVVNKQNFKIDDRLENSVQEKLEIVLKHNESLIAENKLLREIIDELQIAISFNK